MKNSSPGDIIKRCRKDGSDVVFRYLKKEDLHNALEHINSLVRERAFIGVQKKQTIKDERKWISSSLKSMKEGECIVLAVESNGRFIGFGTAKKKPHDANRHVCTIGIAISTGFRKKGIGKELLEILIQQAREVMGCSIAELSCHERNTPARKLYECCEFREAGRVPEGFNHYGEYSDEIIMVRKL